MAYTLSFLSNVSTVVFVVLSAKENLKRSYSKYTQKILLKLAHYASIIIQVTNSKISKHEWNRIQW